MCCLRDIPQPPTGRRRLAQSTGSDQVLLSFKADMTGAPGPALALAQTIQEAPCNIPNACNNFTDVTPVVASAVPIVTAGMDVYAYAYAYGALKIKVSYTIDGVVADVPAIISTPSGTRVSCSSIFILDHRLYTCNVNADTIDGLDLVATAPNAAEVTKPLVQAIPYIGPGEAYAIKMKESLSWPHT